MASNFKMSEVASAARFAHTGCGSDLSSEEAWALGDIERGAFTRAAPGVIPALLKKHLIAAEQSPQISLRITHLGISALRAWKAARGV